MKLVPPYKSAKHGRKRRVVFERFIYMEIEEKDFTRAVLKVGKSLAKDSFALM